MTVVLWIVVIACFALSFVGLIYPILPGVGFIWGGVAIYHFFINSMNLSWLTWGSLGVLTLIMLVTDQFASYFFVKRSGGSKKGSLAATIGALIGCFVLPPFGVIIVPFVLVLIAELGQGKALLVALDIAIGTFIAFFSGTVAKALIQLVMIGIFIGDAIF